MTKNILICSLISLTGMLMIGFYSAHITKQVIETRSFEKRTKNEFSELYILKKKYFDELLFLKSIFLYGNVIQITKQNFNVDKPFCTKINSEIQELILKTIEERVSLPKKDKIIFNQNFQSLLDQCKQFN